MEFGISLLNVAKPFRAQERASANRKGSYPTKKLKEFSTAPMYGTGIYIYKYGNRQKNTYIYYIALISSCLAYLYVDMMLCTNTVFFLKNIYKSARL